MFIIVHQGNCHSFSKRPARCALNSRHVSYCAILNAFQLQQAWQERPRGRLGERLFKARSDRLEGAGLNSHSGPFPYEKALWHRFLMTAVKRVWEDSRIAEDLWLRDTTTA